MEQLNLLCYGIEPHLGHIVAGGCGLCFGEWHAGLLPVWTSDGNWDPVGPLGTKSAWRNPKSWIPRTALRGKPSLVLVVEGRSCLGAGTLECSTKSCNNKCHAVMRNAR